MFRTITTAVVGMVMVFGSMTTPEVEAQRRERSSARDAIRKRVDQELERRREASGQESERRGSRLVDLRERVNERTGQSETAPRGPVTNRIGNRPRRTFGQMYGSVRGDAGDLNSRLGRMKGGNAWGSYLQLDKLSGLNIRPGAVPTEEEVPMETQRRLADALKRFEQIRSNPQYNKISELPEFQSTYNNLQSVMERIKSTSKPKEPPASTAQGKLKGELKFDKPGLKEWTKSNKPGLKEWTKGVTPGSKEVVPAGKVELNFEENNFEEGRAAKRNRGQARGNKSDKAGAVDSKAGSGIGSGKTGSGIGSNKAGAGGVDSKTGSGIGSGKTGSGIGANKAGAGGVDSKTGSGIGSGKTGSSGKAKGRTGSDSKKEASGNSKGKSKTSDS